MGNLFVDIIEMTLPISVWIGLLLLCSPLLKRSYVAKWRYFMWLFVAVRLILPFRLHSQITIEIPSEMAQAGTMADIAFKSDISYTQILTAVWIAGIIIFASYQLISYVSFKRLTKRWSEEICDDQMRRAFEEAKSFAGVKRNIGFKRCKTVTTPMVFGVVKPVLLLPHMDFTGEELPIILRHELVHLRRHDIWYKLLLITARTIHWFNPFAYMMVKAANRDMELACDAEVVKSENKLFRQNYCEAIMKLVHNGRGRGTSLSTCFCFSKKAVMERFKNILDVKIKRSGIVMFCVVMLSIAVSGGAITFATEQVADKVEDDLQLIERPAAPQKTDEPKQNNAAGETPQREAVYIPEQRDTDSAAPSYSNEQPPAENTGAEPPSEAEEPAEDIQKGDERGSVQEQLGEPDVVSGGGNKETYTLSDGTTAVAQYDGETLEAGYILVD